MTEPTRVLFVCLGNIVRSPLAQAIFEDLVRKANADGRYQVDSAGTSDWHLGESPDVRMKRIAAKKGLTYDHHARQFSRRDFDRFDWIMVMDNENLADLLSLARIPEEQARLHMLREFDPLGSPRASVPDPYYGGVDGFEEVYQVIERSCQGLFDALESSRTEQGEKAGE